jgi:hypothetical protein
MGLEAFRPIEVFVYANRSRRVRGHKLAAEAIKTHARPQREGAVSRAAVSSSAMLFPQLGTCGPTLDGLDYAALLTRGVQFGGVNKPAERGPDEHVVPVGCLFISMSCVRLRI